LKKKIVKTAISIIILILFFIGYFFSSKALDNEHLKFIPASAKNVMVINSVKLVTELKNFIIKNPKFLLEFSTKKNLIESGNYGINPINKIAIFQDNLNRTSILGMIVSISDHKAFDAHFNSKKNTTVSFNKKKTTITLRKDENLASLKLGNAGIIFYSSTAKINIDTLSKYVLKNILPNQKIKYDDNDNQILICSNIAKENSFISQYFTGQTSKINITSSGLNFKTKFTLKDSSTFTNYTTSPMELSKNEIGRLSFSLNKENSTLQTSFPRELEIIKNHITGKFWSSVIGFNKKDLIHKDSSIINKNYSFPELAIGIEIDSIEILMQKIKSDSLFKKNNEHYEFSLSTFLNKKFYIFEVKNQIILSTKKINPNECSLEFHTLGLKFDFEKGLNEYASKNIYQTFMISSIKKIKPHFLELNYSKRVQNSLFIEGSVSLGEKNQHFIKALIPMVELLATTADY
jgi:hypothetical protein